MLEFTSWRIATQAWGRSLRFIVAAGELPLIKRYRRQRFRRGQVEKEGLCTLSGRAIARTLHDALLTSLSAGGCDSCAESKPIGLGRSLMRLLCTSAEVQTVLDLLLYLSSPSTDMAQHLNPSGYADVGNVDASSRVASKSVGLSAAATSRNCSKVISSWRKPP